MAAKKNLATAAVLFAFGATAAVGGSSADEGRGEQLYRLCAQCHGPEGAGEALFLAPAIAGLAEWYVTAQLENFRSGVRGTHPDDVGGLRMHPMSLALRDESDLQAAAAYVASLPPARPERVLDGGNVTAGAELYKTCAACHGPDGAGNQATFSPRLSGTSDWYLLSSLQKYKAGIRGANPQNQNGIMMRGMAVQLADEQAIKDVVAHIMTLSGSK